MEFVSEFRDKADDIIDIFFKTFAESEGAEAGRQIKGLVSDMLITLSGKDIFVYSAVDDARLVGTIIFTPIEYPEDPRRVYILSPVAVATNHQGKGLGQRLITYGLRQLSDQGVDVALTYGDPNFYSKVGFQQVSVTEAQAPQVLQFPHGWLAKPLASVDFSPLVGPSRCVAPLDDPTFW